MLRVLTGIEECEDREDSQSERRNSGAVDHPPVEPVRQVA
jgi:hypothetical protein